MVAITAFTILLSSCEKDIIESKQKESIIEIDELTNKIYNLPEVKNFNYKANGNLILENISLVKEFNDRSTGGKVSLFSIPIQTNQAYSAKDFYILYNNAKNKFDFCIYEVEYDSDFFEALLDNAILDINEMTESELSNLGLMYSAKEKISSLEGSVIYNSEFKDNKMISSDKNIQSRGPLDLYCMVVCIVDNMSWYERFSCSVAITNCYRNPSLSCINSLLSCAENEDYFSDCYNNHCYPEETCWVSVVETYNESNGSFDVWWATESGNADYYWMYYANTSNGPWTYFHTTSEDNIRLSVPNAGNWCIAVEAVCNGKGEGIGNNDCIQVLSFTGKNAVENIKVID